MYHANPRLWLRLAEACIATHNKASQTYHLLTDEDVRCSSFSQNSQQGATANFKSKTVRAVFGKAHCRKLVVAPLQKAIRSGTYVCMPVMYQHIHCAMFSSLDTHPQSAAMPAPTLEFSAVCLKNALFLLSCFTGSPTGICPTLPGPPIQGEAITSLSYAVRLFPLSPYRQLSLVWSPSKVRHSRPLDDFQQWS